MKIAAIVLIVFAACGFKGNYDFVKKGGLERVDTQSRTVFNLGMNAVPIAFLAGGVACGIAAYRKKPS